MRVIKIIEKTPTIIKEGFVVPVHVQRGRDYIYGVFICESLDEAYSIEVGKLYDGKKPKFEHRTKGV